MLSTPLKPRSLLQTLILEIDKTQSLDCALHIVVEAICRYYRWSYGEAWQINPKTELLEKRTTFFEADTKIAMNGKSAYLRRFAQISKSVSFPIGAGMPGRIWATGQWEWRTNVSTTSNDVFLRHQAAASFGLKSAFGLPLIDEKGRTIAVLMFFSHHALTQDIELIKTIQTLSIPIGTIINQQPAKQSTECRQARTHALAAQSPAVIFIEDRWGHFTYFSPRLERKLDFKHRKPLNQTDLHPLTAEVTAQVR